MAIWENCSSVMPRSSFHPSNCYCLSPVTSSTVLAYSCASKPCVSPSPLFLTPETLRLLHPVFLFFPLGKTPHIGPGTGLVVYLLQCPGLVVVVIPLLAKRLQGSSNIQTGVGFCSFAPRCRPVTEIKSLSSGGHIQGDPTWHMVHKCEILLPLWPHLLPSSLFHQPPAKSASCPCLIMGCDCSEAGSQLLHQPTGLVPLAGSFPHHPALPLVCMLVIIIQS